MGAPWEKYGSTLTAGPWAKYQPTPLPQFDNLQPAPGGPLPPAGGQGKGADVAPNSQPSLLDNAMHLLGVPLPMGGAEALARGAYDSATLGFGDEGAAALSVKPFEGNWGGQYQANLDRVRAEQKASADAHPWLFGGGQVAGAVPSMLVPGGAAVKGASLLEKMGTGALAGGLYGGAYGAGSADGNLADRALGAGVGAMVGGATGGAVPAIGAGVGKVVGGLTGASAVPTRAATKTQANAFYDLVDKSGLQVDPLSLQAGIQRVKAKVEQMGYDPMYAPTEIKNALAQLEKLSTEPATIRRLDTVRQVLADAYSTTSPKEQRLASVMAKEFDGFINSLAAPDMMGGGSPASVQTALGVAKGLWSTQKKSQVIETALRNADLSGKRSDVAGAYEQSLRNEFTNIAKDPETMATFTADERAAIERAAAGGGLSAWLLRQVGRFSPRRAMGQLGLGATVLSGNWPLALGAGLMAEGSRQGGALAGRRAAAGADALVRNGGVAPFNPAKAARAELLTNSVLGLGARSAYPLYIDLKTINAK